MKTLIAITLAGVAGYFGYTAWLNQQSEPDASKGAPVAEAAPEVAPAPARRVAPATARKVEPGPPQEVAASEPPAPRLAPEGVFFLTQRVSVTTSDGVIGVAPGTKVERLSEKKGILKVSSRGNLFEVRRDQLTNDIGVAERMGAQDASAQAALDARVRGGQKTVADTAESRP